MYCPRCGEENKDTNTICRCCGAELYPQEERSKAAIGVLLYFLLSIIGLILGLGLYPAGSYERNTFCKGWLMAYVGTIIAVVVLEIISLCIYYFG